MRISQLAGEIVQELERLTQLIPDEAAGELADAIMRAPRVFVSGAGRSGLMGKAFAMRLVHMGFDAYVAGETVTRALGKDDVLVLGSGSGGTSSLIAMAHKAEELGGKLAVITTNLESVLGRMAHIVVPLQAAAKEEQDGGKQTVQPMASLFEQGLLIFYDAVILSLMEKKGLTGNTMYSNHANLE
ncbi:6-phospho-3-hexuloisomerase [Paenibacillus sp. KS-LC4]|uniref:6-phospho-3-hexuloisomerase n=1 Tax=Paenibacillus sp. KS-LC4 TaxID=2979727 RepID=UPI0030D14DB7